MSTSADIAGRIRYHKPTDEGIKQIAIIRKTVEAASQDVLRCVPEGREQALALTKLEEAMFWANAGIARFPKYQAEEGR